MFAASSVPNAIPESEYVAPMSQKLTSNDNRKNWSDTQETAQWLGGMDVPRRLLESLQIGGSGSELRSDSTTHCSLKHSSLCQIHKKDFTLKTVIVLFKHLQVKFVFMKSFHTQKNSLSSGYSLKNYIQMIC